MSDAPNLRDYQRQFIHQVRDVIARNFLWIRPRIGILDAGCESTGSQLKQIAELVDGPVIGINIGKEFPSAKAVANLAGCPKASLRNMNAMAMDFPDESFDLVVSANVVEHIWDLPAFLRECSRVLKKDGVAYIETTPVWSGPRGHHVHEDMIAGHFPAESRYRNDGSVIPDWAHLTMSPQEMRDCLRGKLGEDVIDYIIDYIYVNEDLNRWSWSRIKNCFDQNFPNVEIGKCSIQADDRCRPQSSVEDHDVAGFRIIARKSPVHPMRAAILKFAFSIRGKLRRLWRYKIARMPQKLAGNKDDD